jgi:hypothetical protein
MFFISRQNRRANDQFPEFSPDNTADQACHAADSSSSAFASFRSSVSNASVNQPYSEIHPALPRLPRGSSTFGGSCDQST